MFRVKKCKRFIPNYKLFMKIYFIHEGVLCVCFYKKLTVGNGKKLKTIPIIRKKYFIKYNK